MVTKNKKILFATVTVLIGAAVYFARKETWYSHYGFSESMVPQWTVFNPLRDRAPEQVAKKYLEKFGPRMTEESIADLEMDEAGKKRIVSAEATEQLVMSSLVAIRRENESIVYTFRATRELIPSKELVVYPLDIWVAKKSEGYRVIRVSAVY